MDSATLNIKMIEYVIPDSKKKGKAAYLALGWLVIPGLFDSEHIFTLEPLGVKLVGFITKGDIDRLACSNFYALSGDEYTARF